MIVWGACGHESADCAKLCAECGAALARRFASCRSELTSGAKFCPECGAPVAGAAPKVTEKERPLRDGYTPRRLADKILQSRTALEGRSG